MADTPYYFDGSVTPGTGAAGTPGDPAHIIDAIGPSPAIALAQGDTGFVSNEYTHSLTGLNRLISSVSPSSAKPIIFTSTDSSWAPVGPESAAIIDGSGLSASQDVLTVSHPWWWFFNLDIRNSPRRGIVLSGDGCVFIGMRLHGHATAGVEISTAADRPFWGYTHFYDNGGAGHEGYSNTPLPLYRCEAWGNTSVNLFQKSTLTSTAHFMMLGSAAVVKDGTTNSAVTAGLLLMLDSAVISATDLAPSQALIRPAHNMLMINSIVAARVAGVTGIEGASATDAYFGGNDWYNLSTDVGASVTTKVDHEVGAHADVNPNFASVPTDLTTDGLTGLALYQKLNAEASSWIYPGPVDLEVGVGSTSWAPGERRHGV